MRFRRSMLLHRAVTFSCAAALGCALLPAAAFARNEVALRVSTSFLTDSGYHAISQDSRLMQAEISYARALFHAQRGLWAEVSWTVGSSRAELFGQDLELRGLLHSVTAGVRYTLPLRPWLVPCARAGVGLLFGNLTLDGGAARAGGVETQITDHAAGFTAYLLAGVQLLLPRRFLYENDERGITGGLVIEGGVTASTALGFDLGPEPDEELRRIPLANAALGSLAVTGGVIRAGLLLRF